jgi:casein kinase I family protein HRR25
MPNRFCSLNAHFNIFPSFRDDIESLVYMLVFFKKGGDFLNQSTHEQIKAFKLTFVIEDFYTEDFPEEIITIYNYVRLLSFDEFPNYAYLISLFEGFFTKNNLDKENIIYDWIKTMIDSEVNEKSEGGGRISSQQAMTEKTPKKDSRNNLEKESPTSPDKDYESYSNLLSMAPEEQSATKDNQGLIKLYPAVKIIEKLKESNQSISNIQIK